MRPARAKCDHIRLTVCDCFRQDAHPVCATDVAGDTTSHAVGIAFPTGPHRARRIFGRSARGNPSAATL